MASMAYNSGNLSSPCVSFAVCISLVFTLVHLVIVAFLIIVILPGRIADLHP